MRIGVIGGTGIGERLIDEFGAGGASEVRPETPFGRPSGPIRLARLGSGVELALLERHGDGHSIPPHRVPSRANVWALKSLGVTHVVATGACGSLADDVHPGDVVVCDQLLDQTEGRERTFFDGLAAHVEFAEPFCPVTRRWLLDAAGRAGLAVRDGATLAVMDGPAFSTRAESAMRRAAGADLVGMTALPEARLAREAEIAYALVALPTDRDARPHDDAREADLLAEIRANLRRAADGAFALLGAALGDTGALAAERSPAHTALDGAVWTRADAIGADTRRSLDPILSRVLGESEDG